MNSQGSSLRRMLRLIAPVTFAIASFIVRSSVSDSAGYGCSLARISSDGKISGLLAISGSVFSTISWMPFTGDR